MSREDALAPLSPGVNESTAAPWVSAGDVRTTVEIVYQDIDSVAANATTSTEAAVAEVKDYIDGAIQDSSLRVFRAGPSDPSDALGNEGEFYLNFTTHTLFGPKTYTWGTGTVLVGPAGADGDVGPPGPAGTSTVLALLLGD